MRRYQLVDFAAHYQKGFRNHVIPASEVPRLVAAYKNFECYSTYFLFPPEILTYMELHPVDDHPSVAGYDGKIWAPYFLIDLDSDDLDRALKNAKRLGEWLFVRQGLPAETCLVYFSGAKGFHFMLDARLFGRIIPSLHLHLIFSHFRKELILSVAGLDTDVFDLTIKDKVRLLRLPNTVNQKTNRYKIQLLPEELFQFSVADILERAQSPQALYFTDETGLRSKMKSVAEDDKLARLFRRAKRVIHVLTRRPFRYRIKPRFGTDPEKFLCPGLLAIWQSHISAGHRNNCAIRLASEFRRNGLTEDESRALILDWNERNEIALPARELEQVLKSAYLHPFPYHYSCHDEMIQRFCPFQDVRKCDEWVRNKGSSLET